MPLTQTQLEQRKADRAKFIFGSEVAQVLNCSPYGNAADVFHQIVHDVDLFTWNEAADWGNWLEDGIMDRWAAKAKKKIRKNPGKRVKGRLCVHPDAQISDTEHVQAKTGGILVPQGVGEEWGADGSDEIPIQYVIQIHAEFAVLGTSVCYVPCLLGGRGGATFVIRRNEDLVNSVVTRVEAFWQSHIETGIEPTYVLPDMDVLAKLPRQVAKTVEFDDSLTKLVEAMESAREQKTAYEKAADAFKRDVVHAMGDAEIARLADGERELTYFEQGAEDKIDKDAMRADGVYEKYATSRTVRVARVRKIPKATKGSRSRKIAAESEESGDQ